MHKSFRGSAAFCLSGCRLTALVAFVFAYATLGSSAHAAVPLGPVCAGLTVQTGFGTIKGKLIWGGTEAPARPLLIAKGKAEKDPAVCAANEAIPNNELLVDAKTKGIKFAFVYLTKPNGTNVEAAKAIVAKKAVVEIDQENCEFLPYTAAVHQDQTILFKSSDPVNHNVHISPFTNAPFNVILPAKGQIEKKLVAERRVIRMTCDIHPWMSGWIMVFDHPFYAVTADDGSFEIHGVPPGTQNLVIWQAAVGYVNEGLARGMAIEVKSEGVTDVGEIKLDPTRVKKIGQ